MAKILVVEDDSRTSMLVKDWLSSEKYTIELASTGKDAEFLMSTYSFDLIVLDWDLPDKAGIEVLKTYRNNGGKAPIIMMTGKNTIEDKESGLDHGADDYLTKPFEFRELSARIRALLRRPKEIHDRILRSGPLELDSSTTKVSCAGQEIVLLPKEFSVLEFLMRHPNQVFSQESLLNHVWKSDAESTEIAVRTTISRLRKKLLQAGAGSLITAVYGLGYKLNN